MMKIYKLLCLIILATVVGCSDDDNNSDNIESIKILQTKNDTIFLDKGNPYTVTLETSPGHNGVRFYTSNANIFIVDKDEGIITPKGGGFADLIVVGPNGDLWSKALCTVSVTEYVDSIALNSDQEILILPESQSSDVSGSFTAYPLTANNRAFIFKSSNPAVASVDENGVVSSVSKGIAEITAISTDGHNIQSKAVKVYSYYTRKALAKTGWTATAINYQSTSYAPGRMIDGSNATIWHCRWSPATEPPYWVLIDMKQEMEFDQLTLYRYAFYADTRTVEVYTSPVLTDGLSQDDPSFTKIGTIDFGDADRATSNKTIQYFPDTKIKTRYIKLYLPDTNRAGNNSLAEIYLYNVE